MKKRYLTLVVAMSWALTTLSYGLDLWSVVTNPPAPEPTYKVILTNSATMDIDFSSTIFSSMPGFDTALLMGTTNEYDLTEADTRNLVTNIDSQTYYPEFFVFDCPTNPGIDPYSMYFMFNTYNVNNDKFQAHVTFCMEGRCDLTMAGYPDKRGVIHITFYDYMTP